MPRPLKLINCCFCGAVFQSRKSARFCSKKCIWAVTKGRDFNARISKQSAPKRADAMRGTGLGNCYIKRGGRHEHRVVAEQNLGRPLALGEVVHHVDGNKRNNHPDNLEVMTQGEHMRRHGLGIAGMSLHWKPWEYRGK